MGIVTKTIMGVGTLIITVIIVLLLTSTTSEVYSDITVSDKSFSENIFTDNATITTLTKNPTSLTATRKNKTWLSFDGDDDKINLDFDINNTNGFKNTGNHTISFWANVSNGDKGVILGLNDSYWKVAIEQGNLSYIHTNDSSGEVSLNSSGYMVNDSSWHHFAITFQNATGNATMYIDNLANGTELMNNSIQKGVTLNIGNDSNSFYGYLDELRIYNRSLSANEISVIYNSDRIRNNSITTEGLILYLPINARTGTNIYGWNYTNVSQTFPSVISGASWQNGSIDATLTEDTDYSLSTNLFKIINQEVAWNQLTVTYSYSSTNDTVAGLTGNFTAGINKVSSKIPTILLIVAVVFLLGALALLVRHAKVMGVGEGGSL